VPLKVFITTRPEQHIRNALEEYREHEQFHLHNIEDSIVEADIRLYLNFRLSESEVQRALRSHRPPFWQPTEGQKEKLVRISGKLFIVASTAVSFILDPKQLDPSRQVALLLDGISPTDFSGSKQTMIMDHVYLQIIKAARPDVIGNWVDQFRTLVGTIVLLHNPMPCKALARLIGVDVNDVLRTLANLYSILAPKGEKQVFRVHHKSFPDFITDPNRCPEFFVDATKHHMRIAKDCLHLMIRDLRPNLCDLTSDERYKDRTELHDRIQDCVSPHLDYACTYWASHLDAGLDDGIELDADVMLLLELFASRHLFTWMEALSIIGRVYTAYPSLDVTCRVVRLGSCATPQVDTMQGSVEELNTRNAQQPLVARALELFSDLRRLIHRCSDTIRLSPLNIYHSALRRCSTRTRHHIQTGPTLFVV